MKKQNPTHVVSDAPHSKPDAEEIVIKTKAVAVYPTDVALQKTRHHHRHLPRHPRPRCSPPSSKDSAPASKTSTPASASSVPPDLFQPTPTSKPPFSIMSSSACRSLPKPHPAPTTPTRRCPARGHQNGRFLPLSTGTATLALDIAALLPAARQGGETLLIRGASSSLGTCGVQSRNKRPGYQIFAPSRARRNHA